MTAEELEAKDREYEREWNSWWSGLSDEERARFKELGIEGPETPCFTTKRAEFDPERSEGTGLQIESQSAVVLPFLEDIWNAPSVPDAVAAALGDLGSPFYQQHALHQLDIDPEHSPLLRIVLEVVQSETQPGLALAVILKWMGSCAVRESDRDLAPMFGVTFQCVSITRGRVSEKLAVNIFAGKSEEAKGVYRLTNVRKQKNG